MTKKLYKEETEGVYHFFNRGFNRMQVFRDEEDIATFYRIINKASKKTNSNIYHYVVMHNHFHILLYSKDIVSFGKHVMREYSACFNKKYHRRGCVFSSPFKMTRKDIKQYQVELMQYILNNPVMAGLSKTPWGYKYSSLKCFNKIHSTLDDIVEIDKSFTYDLFPTKSSLRSALLKYQKHQEKIEQFR